MKFSKSILSLKILGIEAHLRTCLNRSVVGIPRHAPFQARFYDRILGDVPLVFWYTSLILCNKISISCMDRGCDKGRPCEKKDKILPTADATRTSECVHGSSHQAVGAKNPCGMAA